jgi:Fe2+ or Zn2+ uptake regulation protein
MGVPLGADTPHHDVSSVDDVLAPVRENGGRVTNSRRLLLEAIFHDPGHHCAEYLGYMVQAMAPDVHLSTNYPNLE